MIHPIFPRHPIEAIQRFLCKIFGHRWDYYRRETPTAQELRVCRCCHRAQYWGVSPWGLQATKPAWLGFVQYRTKGAKEYVEGFGQE